MLGRFASRILLLALAVAAVCPPLAAAPNILLVSVDTLRADRMSCYGYRRNTTPRHRRAAGARRAVRRGPHDRAADRAGAGLDADLAAAARARRDAQRAADARQAGLVLEDPRAARLRHRGLCRQLDAAGPALRAGRALRDLRSGPQPQALVGPGEERGDGRGPQRARPWTGSTSILRASAASRSCSGSTTSSRTRRISSTASSRRAARDRVSAEIEASERYDTEVAFVDERDRRAARRGRRAGSPAKSTLVVFVSDHGESLGEHGYWGHGRHLYDVTLHIPMGLVWEGRIAPGVAPRAGVDHRSGTDPAERRGAEGAGVLRGLRLAAGPRRRGHRADRSADACSRPTGAPC